MNRPLALIEGALALPSSRPLSGLPPPFGSWRRSASQTRQGAARPVIAGTSGHTPSSQLRGRIPSNAKFLFFYKLPPRPDLSGRLDEQLAEARGYLDADKVLRHSSRSDRILGGAIFAACSIALAWLLATCSSHDVGSNITTATGPSATASRSRIATASASAKVQPEPVKAPPLAVEVRPPTDYPALAVTVRSPQLAQPTETASSAARAESRVNHSTPRHIVAATRLGKTPRSIAAAARVGSGIEPQRSGFGRAIDSSAHRSILKQPEWTASQASANDSAERAALSDWAAQQRRANVAMRASTPVRSDIDWNAHLTQRRITDNPAAFQAGREPQ